MADSPVKTKKRVVKNPETFRERAAKSVDEGEKPNKRILPVRIIKGVFQPIGRLLKTVFGPIFRLKPVRFIGRILVPEYFRSSWRELKLVKWPTIKQSYQLTFAVIVFAFVFGITIAIVDFGLDKLFKDILLK